MKQEREFIVFNEKQQGAALVVGLIMLLLLTVIGLSAMQGTVMQEKMSANMKDKAVALQGGESTLRYVEEGFIDSLLQREKGSLFDNCNTCGFVNSEVETKAATALDSSPTDWESASLSYGSFTNNGSTITLPSGSLLDPTANSSNAIVVENPRALVEYLTLKRDAIDSGDAGTPGVDLYRSTVKSKGSSETSEVVLQTIYGARFE